MHFVCIAKRVAVNGVNSNVAFVTILGAKAQIVRNCLTCLNVYEPLVVLCDSKKRYEKKSV